MKHSYPLLNYLHIDVNSRDREKLKRYFFTNYSLTLLQKHSDETFYEVNELIPKDSLSAHPNVGAASMLNYITTAKENFN